ncbi:MAG TPA: hypothetical protein VF119_06795 [Candidatus Limnocylindrales bacterium]
MTPLVPIAVGLALLALGFAILRTFGSRYRVGRLLAATPTVSIAEARALADGPPRYVAIRGRIDALDEFEDDAHRPLVLRRARIQLRDGRDWRTVHEHAQVVDFSIREDLDAVDVDHRAVDVGLVVTPREAVGSARDVEDRVPEGTPPDTPTRLRVEQVSSVEHAIVCGVPTRVATGEGVTMTTGLGRPVILTTLEPAEAMRVLADGGTRRPLAAAIAFGAGAVALTIGVVWAVVGAATGLAAAASPSPTAATGGDPRSSGSGPGLVGEPLVAIGLVVAIGIAAIVITTAWIRLTGGRRG